MAQDDETSEAELVVRPHRVRWVAVVTATAVVVVFVVVALLLRGDAPVSRSDRPTRSR